MNEWDRHLTDEEIVRWVDEGDEPQDVLVSHHLDRCEACGARVSAIEAFVSALAAEPPAMTGAEMAAQRERILAAVRSRPRAPVRRLSRPSVWLPAIAAAAVVALLIWAPRATRSPETSPAVDASTDSGTLPVIVDATRAAEEVVAAAGEPAAAVGLVESSPAHLTLPDGTVSNLGEWRGSAELEREFERLPGEAREAILTELASADLGPW